MVKCAGARYDVGIRVVVHQAQVQVRVRVVKGVPIEQPALDCPPRRNFQPSSANSIGHQSEASACTYDAKRTAWLYDDTEVTNPRTHIRTVKLPLAFTSGASVHEAEVRDILPGSPRDQQCLRLPHLVLALRLPVVQFQEDAPHGLPRLPLLREDAERLLK